MDDFIFNNMYITSGLQYISIFAYVLLCNTNCSDNPQRNLPCSGSNTKSMDFPNSV